MRKTREIKKVVLYLRYSSDRQQETSIEGQDEVCTRFCAFNGYEIVGKYIDRAVSARKNVEKRVRFLQSSMPSSFIRWTVFPAINTHRPFTRSF